MKNYNVIESNEENRGIFYHKSVEYELIAETGYGNLSQISNYEEAKTYWFSSNDSPQVKIRFSKPVLITGYTIFRNPASSYATSFILLGKLGQKYRELDSHKGLDLGSGTNACRINCTQMYQTKYQFATKEVILRQFESSMSKKYLLLRALEFYGIICDNYRMLHITKINCKKNTLNNNIILVILFIS